MKLPADCTTLAEVRTTIDALDRELLALLGRRAGYAHAAARFKPDAAVRAPDRVQATLAQRRAVEKRKAFERKAQNSTTMMEADEMAAGCSNALRFNV